MNRLTGLPSLAFPFYSQESKHRGIIYEKDDLEANLARPNHHGRGASNLVYTLAKIAGSTNGTPAASQDPLCSTTHSIVEKQQRQAKTHPINKDRHKASLPPINVALNITDLIG